MKAPALFLSTCLGIAGTVSTAFGQFKPNEIQKIKDSKDNASLYALNCAAASRKIAENPPGYIEKLPKSLFLQGMQHRFVVSVDTSDHLKLVVASVAFVTKDKKNYGASIEETRIDTNDDGVFQDKERTQQSVAFDLIQDFRKDDLELRQSVNLLSTGQLYIRHMDKDSNITRYAMKDNCIDAAKHFHQIADGMLAFFRKDAQDAVMGTKNPPYLKPVKDCLITLENVP